MALPADQLSVEPWLRHTALQRRRLREDSPVQGSCQGRELLVLQR